jgi:hypothetical protein
MQNRTKGRILKGMSRIAILIVVCAIGYLGLGNWGYVPSTVVCRPDNGITQLHVIIREVRLRLFPIRYQENTFNRYPEFKLIVRSGLPWPPPNYFRKHLFDDIPDRQLLNSIERRFNKIAVLKVKVANRSRNNMYFHVDSGAAKPPPQGAIVRSGVWRERKERRILLD